MGTYTYIYRCKVPLQSAWAESPVIKVNLLVPVRELGNDLWSTIALPKHSETPAYILKFAANNSTNHNHKIIITY